ncbi:MAG: LysM peptidoglycan-binding domain-containing protein [Lachnospiraceae bacterium]|jgi:hypothetical protein|nr:LysM peptidoglycan-binding domain-containing protein [Lachnospiraceae bacterium]
MDNLALYENDLRRTRNKRRREREVKRKLLMGVTGALLIIILSIALGSILSLADSGDAVHSFKYFTSIEIESGDTLISIAHRYIDLNHYTSIDAYIGEVIRINNLRDDNIIAGHNIIVPYYSSEFVGER